jgi:hypothetical protein
MVDGARLRPAAIARIERPATNSREISSLSSSVSVNRERRRGSGSMPPVSASIRWIDEWLRSNSWAIC